MTRAKAQFDLLMECAVHVFDVSEEDIVSERRFRNLVNIRRMMFYVMRHKFGMEYSRIGTFFNRNHTTILSCLKKHDDFCLIELEYASAFNEMLTELNKRDVFKSRSAPKPALEGVVLQ